MSLRKKDPKKKCSHCKKPLARKRFGERLESLSAFKVRKYCNLRCYAKAVSA